MEPPAEQVIALVTDVDGVVSPLGGCSAWGDDVQAGDLSGPVFVSPTLCERLDNIASHPFVDPWWLTSWTADMRATMLPFPGATWRSADGPEGSESHQGSHPASLLAGEHRWKWGALVRRVLTQENLVGVIWCEDHLGLPVEGGLRKDAVKAELDSRGLCSLLLAPNARQGLTPDHLDKIESWLTARS